MSTHSSIVPRLPILILVILWLNVSFTSNANTDILFEPRVTLPPNISESLVINTPSPLIIIILVLVILTVFTAPLAHIISPCKIYP